MNMKKLIRLALLLLLVYLFFKVGSAVFDADRGPKVEHLTNRPWIARLPTSSRDMVPQLLLLEAARQRVGASGAASTWRIAFDMLKWKLDSDELQVDLPQENIKAKVRVRTWACDDAPKPLDLCLELRAGGEQIVLFSKRAWKVRDSSVEGFDDSETDRYVAGFVESFVHRPGGNTGECKGCEERPGSTVLERLR